MGNPTKSSTIRWFFALKYAQNKSHESGINDESLEYDAIREAVLISEISVVDTEAQISLRGGKTSGIVRAGRKMVRT
jgi:hypothetical protein